MISPYSRTRNRQLIRVLKLIAILQKKGATVKDLAVTLEVSQRTIWRDLNALDYAGLPLRNWGDRSSGSVFTLRPAA